MCVRAKTEIHLWAINLSAKAISSARVCIRGIHAVLSMNSESISPTRPASRGTAGLIKAGLQTKTEPLCRAVYGQCLGLVGAHAAAEQSALRYNLRLTIAEPPAVLG